MLVELVDVSVSLGRKEVLRSVDLRADRSDLVALTGPSGSGKSTLLTTIANRLNPRSGKVTVNVAKKHIDWMVQDTPLLQRRSVIDNVSLMTRAQGLNTDQATLRAVRALKDVGMLRRAREPVHVLSGGEKQRVAIARAISSRSELLLADEPTASLDRLNRDSVMDAFRRAAGLGACIIIATHDPYIAQACDVVFELRDGVVALSA